MKTVGAPNYPQRFPSWLYPDVPELSLISDSTAATDLARLVVTLAVDRRSIHEQQETQAAHISGIMAAHRMTNAARRHGLEATVSLRDGPDGFESTKVHYTQWNRGAAGLVVRTHDLHYPPGMRTLYWKPEQGGSLMLPHAPLPEDALATESEPFSLDQMAAYYDILRQRITEPNHSFPLSVLYTTFKPIEGLPPLSDFTGGPVEPTN